MIYFPNDVIDQWPNLMWIYCNQLKETLITISSSKTLILDIARIINVLSLLSKNKSTVRLFFFC